MYRGVFLFIISILSLPIMTCNIKAATQDKHLIRAKELCAFERWSDARIELQRVKSHNPLDLEEVEYYLALCSIGVENWSALASLDSFSSQHPKSLFTNQIDFNRALLLAQEGEFTSAKEEFNKVDYGRLTSSEREKYDIRMAYIALLNEEYDLAKEHFNRIAEESKYFEHAQYFKSYIAYIDGDLPTAREGFTELTSSNSYREIAPYYLLQIAFISKDYSYVTTHGDKLMQGVTPQQRGEIARMVAEANFKQGNFDDAVRYISMYQNDGAKMSREDSYIMGFSLYRTARYEAACDYLRAASGADDALTQNASYHLADCYLRGGNKRGAMQAFAMASNEKYNAEIAEEALFNYGKLQFDLGGGVFNEAINVLSRYVENYPHSKRTPEAKKLLAAAYYNSSNYDAAYKAIKEVKNPDADIRAALQKITYFRALAAMNKGNYTLAKENFIESERIGISPKYSALSRFWQGEIAYYEGDYTAALNGFNNFLSRASKSEQTYVMAHYSTAFALLKIGNEEAAMRYFERFIELSPQNNTLTIDAHNRIGDIRYGMREFNLAAKSYKSAAAVQAPGADYSKYQLYMIDGIIGKVDKKIVGLNSIVASQNGAYVDDALYELGRTYIAQERYAEAVKSLERFIVEYPTSSNYSQALSDLGLSYLNLGDRSTSISYYDRAIKSAPQSAVSKDAIQGIREIYIDQGDAKGYFEYAEKIGVESDLGSVAKDSLSFASAQRLYLQENNRRAEGTLSSYIKDFPQGYYFVDALYLLSDCQIKDGDKSGAIENLEKLTNIGANQYTHSVLSRLSKLTDEAQMYNKAALAYRKLYDVAKSDEERASAMESYARCVIVQEDNTEIMKMAEDVLSQPHSGDKAIVKAKRAKATILRENGEWTEAIAIYQDLSSKPLTEVGAEANYYLINSAHRGGDIEHAKEMIFKFAESGTTQAYWLAKAFITLGDIYVVEGDSFQARATYQSIVDGYAVSEDGVIEEAKNKIEKLN